jgi:hypothetical protein
MSSGGGVSGRFPRKAASPLGSPSAAADWERWLRRLSCARIGGHEAHEVGDTRANGPGRGTYGGPAVNARQGRCGGAGRAFAWDRTSAAEIVQVPVDGRQGEMFTQVRRSCEGDL